MLYSCELLEHHVKMSTEGFGTAYCFLKQIVTNLASEFVFIHIQIGSQYSLFFFFFYLTAEERETKPLFSQWSHLHEKVPLKYCSISSFHTLSEDWIKGVALYWYTGCCQVFNLAAAVEGLISYPPGPVSLAYSLPSLSWQQCQLHWSPCRPLMSFIHVPWDRQINIVQATHILCYQQDTVSFYEVFKPLTTLVCISLELSDSTNAFGSSGECLMFSCSLEPHSECFLILE